MANDPKRPRIGELAVDTTELAGQAGASPEGARRRLHGNQPGREKARKEIRDNQPLYGELAGVTGRNFEDLRATDEHRGKSM
jgi:hypothetical protein